MNKTIAKKISTAALACVLIGVAAPLSLAQDVQAQLELTADSQGKPAAQIGVRASES